MQTEARRYTPGDTAAIVVKNSGSRALTYNLCRRELERQSDSDWRVVASFPPDGSACVSSLRVLPPNDSVRMRVPIPTDAPRGTYRLRFLDPVAGISATNDFEVGP